MEWYGEIFRGYKLYLPTYTCMHANNNQGKIFSLFFFSSIFLFPYVGFLSLFGKCLLGRIFCIIPVVSFSYIFLQISQKKKKIDEPLSQTITLECQDEQPPPPKKKMKKKIF